MTRPVIAISPSYNSDGLIRMRPDYLDALWEAGAIGVFVAYTTDPARLDAYAEEFDGFLFAGGVDVDPKHYGESVQHDSVEICAERDAFELELARRVLKTDKPVLGICRGVQLLNVAMGGSLHQHIDGHSQREPRGVPTHRVTLTPGTRLEQLIGCGQIMVNSFHHQAVKQPAPGLSVAAVADDGTIEAVCLPGERFLVGVQWHPELLHTTEAAARSIFEGFCREVKHCMRREGISPPAGGDQRHAALDPRRL